ncbi:MAG: hypothetical protein LQ350_007879 [Teloschistes chrysophthalmus]|nr:MAG: hypothetical protein LQ350_007879 [Niorma chrysophthalma]
MSKMITLSTVIGTGLLNGGSVLRSAGPGGEILSLVVVGLVVICVMEGISEMIQKFSVPNALVVFVRTFVDEELAHVVAFAHCFVGVEAVSVTAYEARSLKDLRQPSKIIAILVLTIYLPYTLAEGIGISWKSPWLPRSYGDPGLPQNGTETVYPAPVIVAMQVHVDSIANFFEAFIIYAAFSTSNASLYIASRILYGSAEYASHDAKWLQHFTRIWSSGVPRWCVLASALSFWWVPFSQLVHNQSTENVG